MFNDSRERERERNDRFPTREEEEAIVLGWPFRGNNSFECVSASSFIAKNQEIYFSTNKANEYACRSA